MKPFRPEDAALYPAVIGIDEVGRGALCGPVVVAAVWFDPLLLAPELLARLDDSKRLGERERLSLARALFLSTRVAITAASAPVIDRIGIRHATLDAMRRAALRIGIVAPVLIDGCDVPPNLSLPATAIVRADGKIPQVAAASIVAKTTRDLALVRLAARYSEYCWDHNKGYGTPDHLNALARLGPTRHHRRSYSPVSACQRSCDISPDPSE